MSSPLESAPQFGPSDVIGPQDSRTKPANLAVTPYLAICLLHPMAARGGRAIRIGTGWLVARSLVVTAGHVLEGAHTIKGWFAYDDSAGRAVSEFEETGFEIHPEYVQHGSSAFDVGVIRLASALPELSVLDVGQISIGDNRLHVAGYPLDRPWDGLNMAEAQGELKEDLGDILFHDVDAEDGQSGAPIWQQDPLRVVAMHTTGKGGTHPQLNGGVVMNDSVLDWIKSKQ
ncbi:MAG: trypsin-like peptidase domain-containing protein [Chromatiaceae bacterium]|nr:trypsin-like peptidase domain-containing protein [Chromatiaceae bacterium]MCP5314912.1 trypsin-like peptidase domain-containing protein [Chromatiaceae bacterium]